MFYRIILFTITLLTTTSAFSQSGSNKTIIEDRKHYSKVFNQMRDCRFFLPPDYYKNPEKRYPVIYYFHGFCGRYNGPLVPVDGVYIEARYFDEFNGSFERCGFDSLDNIAEFVRTHDVIVVKWDGYVKEQYPRPYNIGYEYTNAIPEFKQKMADVNMQFIDYFPEFVKFTDSSLRTIPSREGRAVTGLSMGGFMSMFVASKYPHLISSASFFSPSVGFVIGPQAMKVYTPFTEMALNYTGMPIRMHIGSKDFIRQHHLILDRIFRTLGLNYESWHYGSIYAGGVHEIYDIPSQFNFHMKYFRIPFAKPEKWYHNDAYSNFDVWNYKITSDRKEPGFTLIEDATNPGLKLTARKWLPGGPAIADVNYSVKTDSLYVPSTEYEMIVLEIPSNKITKKKILSDASGSISFNIGGGGSEIGIYKKDDPGFIAMPSFKTDVKMPKAWQQLSLSPVLFNKGGKIIDSVKIDLFSLDQDVEVITPVQTIGALAPGELYQKTSFKLRSRNEKLDHAKLKLVVKYNQKTDYFMIDLPFCNPESALKDFQISDGKKMLQELGSEMQLGEGNKNGVAEPGEWISIITKSDKMNLWWNALELATDDPYVDLQKSRMKYDFFNDRSGAMKPASELYIKPGCPKNHVIKLYGTYNFQKPGNVERDGENSMTNLHETRRVAFEIKVGGK